MARVKGCEAVYELADQWRDRCLIGDGSLLWPDETEPTWTVENLEALMSAIWDHPDNGSDSFVGKLQRQLADHPVAIHRLASDLAGVYSLFPRENMGKNAKLKLVDEISVWKAGNSPIRQEIEFAFSTGLGNPGPAYLANRPKEISFFARFASLLKQALAAPVNFDSAVQSATEKTLQDFPSASSSRNIVRHLLLPDQYEAIASGKMKHEIVAAFQTTLDLPSDVDESLALIRAHLNPIVGRTDYQFWDDDVVQFWQPDGVIVFKDDTPGYLAWATNHPKGFVLNTRRKPVPNDLLLHYADCNHLATSDTVNLTQQYIKVCCTAVKPLLDWAMMETGPAANVRACSTCKPPVKSSGDRRYWKISAGSGATDWNKFRDEAYIAIGFNVGSDVSLFSVESKQAFAEMVKDSFTVEKGTVSAAFAADQFWKFVYEMEIGDFVCVYNAKAILGTGTINSEYYFHAERDDWHHRRDVQWDSTSTRSTLGLSQDLQQKLSLNRTIIPLTESDFEEISNISTIKQPAWIFQANPERYNYLHHLRQMNVGDLDDWSVPSHRAEIKAGDRVGIWLSGGTGLVSLGEIDGEPFERPAEGYTSGKSVGGNEWAVNYRLTEKLDPPISREQIKSTPGLENFGPIKFSQGTNYRVTPEEWEILLSLIGDGPPTDRLGKLAERTFIVRPDLEELESMIHEKKQIILEGPPGSGKTYLARLFARYLAGVSLDAVTDPHVEIVQFHQSYGYEDFVAGIRPETVEGQIQYHVQPGIFIEMCQRAAANPDETFVLIIDEINRGNLSRIFGELLYGIEYRDQPVRLQYGDLGGDLSADHLTIPPNLLLIGTMNSTDRSLALVDYALRRRFYFWKLRPVDTEGKAPVLEQWLRANQIPAELANGILRAFIDLNLQVQQRLSADHQIGHSYLMDSAIGNASARERIWRRAILPLLAEYFHARKDQHETLEELEVSWNQALAE